MKEFVRRSVSILAMVTLMSMVVVFLDRAGGWEAALAIIVGALVGLWKLLEAAITWQVLAVMAFWMIWGSLRAILETLRIITAQLDELLRQRRTNRDDWP